MKIAEIYAILDEIAPFNLQESWDNSGLLVGDFSENFDEIILSLDVDSILIEKAPPNALFITHHPLIFKGLKSLNPTKFPANLIAKMIKKDIKLIAMHTNFDICALNKFVLGEILGYQNFSGENFLLKFEPNKPFDELVSQLKQTLNIPIIRGVKAQNFIKTAAFCTGSGGDLIDEIDVDCFISGDFKYHAALKSYENHLSLIDIGHFESERYFGDCLAKYLQKRNIFAKIATSINPFTYY